MQIQGKDRAAVAEAGRKLGLDGTYIARSYIEQVTSLFRVTALHFPCPVVKLDGQCLVNDIDFTHSCKHMNELDTVMHNVLCIVQSRLNLELTTGWLVSCEWCLWLCAANAVLA